jgi:hypothetical protein
MENVRYIDSVGYMESVGYRNSNKDNRSCYYFESIKFNSALLDIDATYIVHLVNNGRMDSVRAQLNEFRPTKEVFILHNKGYKKCDKEEYINKPPLDLVDAFLYIFKDAQQKNYKNVLILEDDFIFNNKIKNKMVRQNIMNFISNKNYDVYVLGLLPFLQRAYDKTTNICLLGGGTHAFIYSRECINKVLQDDKKSIEDWDIYIGKNFRKYMYNEPLCYQLFPETENQKHWENNNGVKLQKYIINKFKLDTQVEPGYSIMYTASKAVYGLCVILCVWFLLLLINYNGYT